METPKFNTRKAKAQSVNDVIKGLGKLPPQAVEVEEVVLGALMIEKDALTTVIDILKPESFYSERHQKIYGAIRDLFLKSEPIDLMTVTSMLRTNGDLEFVGGPYYLNELTFKVNSSANIEYHARIIVEQAIKRELISIASKIETDAFEYTTDVFQLLDRTQSEIFRIAENNIRKNYADMRSIMSQAVKELEERSKQKEGLTGVPSGFTELDRITSGWQKSDLVIVAARPGMGKCLGKGTKVLMFDGSLKNVEDVQEGELLMGDDSTPRKVLSIARGQENMYWIRQKNAIDYRVNESHILSLKRNGKSKKHPKGEVLNITVKDYLEKSDKFKTNYKGYKVAVEFEEKQTEIDPYIFGFLLGCVNPDTNLKVQISAEKASHKEEYLSVNEKLTHKEVIDTELIPSHFLTNSRENRLHLLGGLLDSKGVYNKKHNCFEISHKNEALAKQIKFLCDTLGFQTSIKKKEVKFKSVNIKDEVFKVRFAGNIGIIPSRIDDKKLNKASVKKNWKTSKIVVEFDKVDDYYGFEIDGNRLFLLEDMTVTHNTAFVVSCMRNASVDHNKGVAIFSLEMSSVQLVNRLISAEAELGSEKIKKGNLTDIEWSQLHAKTKALANAPIFIDDTPALTILELRAKCRRLKAQHDIQMVIIDYLQLMSADGGGKGGGNREQEISAISRSLKQLAKELEVPVIALSQLSRSVETRGGDKRPQLSDLRESGAIEQDADMVIFLYRPDYYKITEDEEGNSVVGMGEVIIAKHRNGSLDTAKLRFRGEFTRFEDWASDSFAFDTTGGSLNAFPITGSNEFDMGSGAITLESKMNDKPLGGFNSGPFDEEPPF
ncbi:MAG: replicative helicase [Bacteroidota bacterium]|jgi:replicative DNA helicase